MKVDTFLASLFLGAIFYQLTTFEEIHGQPVDSDIKSIKLDNDSSKLLVNNIMFNTSDMFKNIEHVKNVEHLKKPNRYKLSKKGKDFIKSHEDCKLRAYNDPDPKRRSVGWGHQIQPDEKLEHITKAKANELFEKDIEWVNDAINRLIAQHDNRFIYSQGFIDGLGDMIYNCGERGVTLTEFWNRWQKCRYDKNQPGYINKNDWNYTIAAVKTSRISAKGHIERRYNTHVMMLN